MREAVPAAVSPPAAFLQTVRQEGNASPITDGAAALVLTTLSAARAAAAGCEVMLNFDTLDIP